MADPVPSEAIPVVLVLVIPAVELRDAVAVVVAEAEIVDEPVPPVSENSPL
jgi:hypothetical protein